ncbi:MAG: 2OG-Fe(II) oxygenase [Gallionella sp.]
MDIANIAKQLEHTGYIVLDSPLQKKSTAPLLTRCHDDDTNRFQAAHLGRGWQKKQIRSRRGDVISWLDTENSIDAAYLNIMEKLRIGLNAILFLGLFDYECHYAIYHSGTAYARHSDVLTGRKNRILSTVLYLNEGWQPCDGGELILYKHRSDTVIATITPTFGKMILFLSESFPHEVLLSRNTRRSLTGWFRVNGH